MKNDSKNGKKKSRHLLLIIIILVLLILIIPIIYIMHILNKTNYDASKDDEIIINEEVTEETDNKISSGYTNFVIFGVDSRSNSLTKATRSDTIMLVGINNKTKEVKLCSIYRDTYVDVPSHGYTKINHAYAYGGYSLALSTINQNFDLNVTQYVTVNFYAVTRIIDLLGGITLDIEQNELKWLNGYLKEINRVNGTSVSGLSHAGTQTVNGSQALAYARIRYTAGGDYKRAERQRIVVEKIFEKAKKSNLSTITAIINEMLPKVATNITTVQILSLGKDILNYTIKDSIGFPFEKKSQKINRVSYVLPINLSNNVISLHEYLFDTMQYQPSNKVQTISDYISSIE